MQYTLINGIEIKDLTNSHKDILEYDFLKQSDKNKLITITNNVRLTYKEDISTKYNKIKDFLLENHLINKELDNSIFDRFIIKLLAKLIYEYSYLMKV